MKKHELTRQSIFNAQVCSVGTWDEALEWVRETNPSGTQNNWSKAEGENLKPVPCKDHPDRTHYVFVC